MTLTLTKKTFLSTVLWGVGKMASFYTTNTTTVGIVSILCQMMENCSPRQREKCLGIALHPLDQSTTTPQLLKEIWRCKVSCYSRIHSIWKNEWMNEWMKKNHHNSRNCLYSLSDDGELFPLTAWKMPWNCSAPTRPIYHHTTVIEENMKV